MNCHRAILMPVLTAALFAAGRAGADDAIVFSKPASLPTEKANSFMEQAPHQMSDAYNAPSPMFGGTPQADFDAAAGQQLQQQQQFSAEQLKQWQKLLDKKKNWTLLTPEEILGVPTSKKILGLSDAENDERLTVEQRYIRRQERQLDISQTNGLHQSGGFSSPDENPFQKQSSNQQQFNQDQRLGQSARNYFGQPMTAQAGVNPRQSGGMVWKSAFNPSSVAEAKPDLEQAALMERFRAMMEPPQREKPVVPAGFSQPAPPVHDPNMQPMPAYNPAGNSFAPVHDFAGRPTGIVPLPTITGARPALATPEKRKPLVNLPPWMTEDDKPPTAPPQRKF